MMCSRFIMARFSIRFKLKQRGLKLPFECILHGLTIESPRRADAGRDQLLSGVDQVLRTAPSEFWTRSNACVCRSVRLRSVYPFNGFRPECS